MKKKNEQENGGVCKQLNAEQNERQDDRHAAKRAPYEEEGGETGDAPFLTEIVRKKPQSRDRTHTGTNCRRRRHKALRLGKFAFWTDVGMRYGMG